MPRSHRFERSLPSLALAISVGVGLAPTVTCAGGHNWRSLTGRHFSVSYDESTADIAHQALGIAEATAEQLEGYFGWRQNNERIAIVLSDDDDYSNGYSMGRTPLVHVYCRKTPLDWRGETNWLETVLSHELSHVYTLMQMQRPFGVSVGIGQHDDARREDAEIQAAWDVDDLPRWFVEGVAQIGSVAFKADARDPWREALLADAYRTGRILSLSGMGRFEGTSRESELAYNQGFDLVMFLQARYPKADFRSLCRRVGDSGFGDAVRATYGKSISQLYGEWIESLAIRFPALPAIDPGAWLFKGREGPLVAEMNASGSYAVANWKHDALRYDLFELDPSGDASRVARDVGEKVVVDPATGDAWYTSMFLETDKDAEQYDIFRRARDGSVFRETWGARSIAFDVAAGVLVYARYHAGTTDLVRRDLSKGTESVLHSFPRDTAIYGVSVASPDSIYLSLGTGDAVRAASVVGSAVKVLWPLGASVLSVAAIGGDTLVMVAVDSGVPRLVWSVGEGSWHRIGSPVAARSVWMDRAGRRILASIYQQGDFRVKTVAPNFADTTETVEMVESKPAQRRAWSSGRASAIAPNWIRMPVYFDLGYGIYGRSDRIDTSNSGAFQAYVTEEWMDPTESWGIGATGGGAFLPLGSHMPKALPAASLWSWHHSGSRRFTLGYSYRENGQVFDEGGMVTTYTMSNHAVQAYVDAALSNDFAAKLEASYNWETQSASQVAPSGQRLQSGTQMVFSLWQGGVAFGFGRGDSRLDPAGLGAPGCQGQAQADVFRATLLQDIVDGDEIWRDPQTYFDGMAAVGARTWVVEDLASLSAKLDAYGTFGGIDSAIKLPGSHGSMGGSAPFRGYADDFLDLRAFARATMELRLSPFATRDATVSWNDRTRIASRLEVGDIQYLSKVFGYDRRGNFAKGWEEKTTYAASWDLSLRQGYFFGNTRPSWVEVGFAMPLLSSSAGRRDDPYRVFFGMQIF